MSEATRARQELCLKFCRCLSNEEMQKFLSYGDPLSAYTMRQAKDAVNTLIENYWRQWRGHPIWDVGTLEKQP